MSSDHHSRVKELFLAACEQPPEKRQAFLDAECGQDEALRAEVAELLDFHEEETTGEGSAAAGRLEDLESIANFRVLQKVGEGGMGEVYEAEQTEPVRRRVALKVIKWGMDTKEVLARFESERQALALMNHPNIARVFEAGSTDSGRPYFAMEYVKGVPITEYCDTHRLTTVERLELFVQVCEGVQHAHQRGVIHRDMKPSNVLVTIQDDRSVPKIIDFGVAKATSQRLTERTVFTELGQWIGTPEYMSPEQAEMTGLDIDTRTDVYSLGVVLYELLVGAQPFDSTTLRKAGFDEMRRRIREEEPPRPSTRVSSLGGDSEVAAQRRKTDPTSLARELKGDLDWIIMKALEKDRTRRYSTPMELAEDVERHLRNDPVEASPPSTAYQMRKFVRRNRVAVAAASLVVAALILGIIGTSVGLVRAQREAESARQVVRLMSDILGGMNPGAVYGHAQSIDEILDRGTVQIDRTLQGQPLVEAHLKDLIGRVYIGLGKFSKARPVLEQAHAIRRAELGENHPAVADSMDALGAVEASTGDYASALRLYEQALRVYERTVGQRHGAVGNTLTNICQMLWRLGEYDRAIQHCDRGIEILEGYYGTDHLLVTNPVSNKAIVVRELGESAQALVLDQRVLEIRERHLGPNNTLVGWAVFHVALDRQFLGDRESARDLYERAYAIQEEALGPESHAASMPLQRLASFRNLDGDVEGAREMFRRAVEIRENALGEDHPDLVWVLRPYGHVLRNTGDVEQARQTFERAVAIAEKAYGPEHLEYALSLGALAYHLYAQGDLTAARQLFERNLEIQLQTLGPNARRLGSAHYNLTCISALQGRRQEALDHLRNALDTGWSWRGVFEDSDLDSLRGDPEFEAMMEEMRQRIEEQ